MTTPNWRTMDAGHDLDLLIDRLVQRVRYQVRGGEDASPPHSLPPYSTSVDVALTLPLEEGAFWVLLWPAAPNGARATLHSAEWRDGSIFSMADTLAFAMCKAWLGARESRCI